MTERRIREDPASHGEESGRRRIPPAAPSSQEPWESAYLRYETPEEETCKFLRRLRRAGALQWAREGQIVELFCGRGNGLRALERLGFSRFTGIDLSPTLAAQGFGRGRIVVGDCRRLPYATGTQDVATIHGGLHHLPRLPEDLDQTLAQIRNVLKEDGLLFVVEPWQTPFLSLAHRLVRNRFARRLSGRIDALGSMIEQEGQTYQRWLASPQLVMDSLRSFFHPEMCREAWGKLLFVGRRLPGEGRGSRSRSLSRVGESQSCK